MGHEGADKRIVKMYWRKEILACLCKFEIFIFLNKLKDVNL